jgi:uncharacterized protein YidB (DUF937 family)
MGLLDGILSNVLGGALGGAGGNMNRPSDSPLGGVLDRIGGGSGVGKMAFLALAFQLLQSSGGLSGLLDKLRNAGLGAHADSWVGTGNNLPVAPDQLQQGFGPDLLEQLASRFGMSQHEASGTLAQVLPELVNQMTPQGQVPAEADDAISDALSQLAPRVRS